MTAHLTDSAKTSRVLSLTAAGTDDAINSLSVDMQGFDACRFIVGFGTVTDGVHKVKIQQSSDDGSSDAFADVANTLTDTGAVAADDNDLIVTDIIKPNERYLRATVVRAGGVTGAVIDFVIAELYMSRDIPVTQDSTVVDNVREAHQVEGTA